MKTQYSIQERTTTTIESGRSGDHATGVDQERKMTTTDTTVMAVIEAESDEEAYRIFRGEPPTP